MYVCICNGVTEDDVLNSVAEGARTTKAVRAACGMTPGCGTCTKLLCALVSDYRAAADEVNSITGGPLLPLEVVPGRPREAACGEACDGACGTTREPTFDLVNDPEPARVRQIAPGGSAPQNAA